MADIVSIVLVQYNPQWEPLKHTLDSILMQDTEAFELIIADDGSKEDYFATTREYLAAHAFHRAKFVKTNPNAGTVINALNAVREATGGWVHGISPGDYLYDAHTVKWMLEMLLAEHPRVAFGKAAYYTQTFSGIKQISGETPFDKSCYLAKGSRKKAKRNLLLYDDGLCGACLIYERQLFLQALELMQGKVKYAEDYCVRLFAAQGIPMRYYDREICWYEYGTGISTDGNAGNYERLKEDHRAMLRLLRRQYPHDFTVRMAYEYAINDCRKSKLIRGIVGRLIVPQWLPFKRAQKQWEPPVNGDMQVLQKIYAIQPDGKEKKK